MRTLSKWLVLAGVPVLASACFSSNNQTPPDAGPMGLDAETPDGAETPEPEPEAGPVEAGPDAPLDQYVAPPVEASVEASVDAGPLPITVLVQSALGAEQGVAVVYQDAFSELVANVTTDALGSASQVVPGGGQVTVVMGNVLAPRLVTIEAVVPGDVLTVYDPSFDLTNAQVNVSLGGDGGLPPGTGSVYTQIGPCSNSGLPATIALDPDCMSQGKFPVLLVASAGADGGYANFAYAYQNDNVLALDGGANNVVVPDTWYPVGSQTVTIANGDAGTFSGNFSMSLDEIADNVGVPQTQYGSLSTDFGAYPFFATSQQGEIDESLYNGGYFSTSGIATRGFTDGGVATFDATQLLPMLDSVSLDTTNPSQPILTWGAQSGRIQPADGVIAQISWNDSSDAGDSIAGTWTLIAPPGVQAATFPAVPSSLAYLAPSATANFATIPSLVVIDADFISGYDQLRAQASTLPLSQNLLFGNSGAQAPALPVDGTLRLSAIAQAGD